MIWFRRWRRAGKSRVPAAVIAAVESLLRPASGKSERAELPAPGAEELEPKTSGEEVTEESSDPSAECASIELVQDAVTPAPDAVTPVPDAEAVAPPEHRKSASSCGHTTATSTCVSSGSLIYPASFNLSRHRMYGQRKIRHLKWRYYTLMANVGEKLANHGKRKMNRAVEECLEETYAEKRC